MRKLPNHDNHLFCSPWGLGSSGAVFDDGGQCGRGLGMPKTRWKCLRDLEGTLCDEVMNSQCMTVFQIYIYMYILIIQLYTYQMLLRSLIGMWLAIKGQKLSLTNLTWLKRHQPLRLNHLLTSVATCSDCSLCSESFGLDCTIGSQLVFNFKGCVFFASLRLPPNIYYIPYTVCLL